MKDEGITNYELRIAKVTRRQSVRVRHATGARVRSPTVRGDDSVREGHLTEMLPKISGSRAFGKRIRLPGR